MGKALSNFDCFANDLKGGETPENYEESLMKLKEDIFNVSETLRANQIKYINMIQRAQGVSYQQVMSEINMILSYLQNFAVNLSADGNWLEEEDQLEMSEDNYWKVLFELVPTSWYDQLMADGKNAKRMGPAKIKQTF
eukprot:8000450-Ditylum_brightwellii.AAC.1